ncbi:MAG TPA: LysM domain-containing protein [Solirubrobacteraceae bacterium]|jgi:hypothetical protein|nr:LysM domain-containing protein [Solirubrobacteraceae bacterium]
MTSALEAITGGAEAPPEDSSAAGPTPYDLIVKCKGWKTQVGGYRTDAPIEPSLGYGGHPIAVRPKTSALTVWEGRQPFQLDVPMLFSGNHVPELCRLLDQMASAKPPTSNLAQPTAPYAVTIHSTVGSLPLPGGMQEGDEWWIEDLKWGDEKRNTLNELYYKEVVVTLLETVVDVTLKTKGAHAYTVKHGDTWARIAAKQLGDQERQYELREMNGNKTNAQLAKMAGKRIRIPQSI